MRDSHLNSAQSASETDSKNPDKSVCPYCSCIYSKKNLMRHIENVHGKIDYFACEFCRRKFQKEEYLEKHLKACSAKEQVTGIVHERRTPKKDKATCPIDNCSESFSSRTILQRHLINKHSVTVRFELKYTIESFSNTFLLLNFRLKTLIHFAWNVRRVLRRKIFISCIYVPTSNTSAQSVRRR